MVTLFTPYALLGDSAKSLLKYRKTRIADLYGAARDLINALIASHVSFIYSPVSFALLYVCKVETCSGLRCCTPKTGKHSIQTRTTTRTNGHTPTCYTRTVVFVGGALSSVIPQVGPPYLLACVQLNEPRWPHPQRYTRTLQKGPQDFQGLQERSISKRSQFLFF